MKKYIVRLSEQEREELEKVIATGKGSVKGLMHARILLKADESEAGPSCKDEKIEEALEVSISTHASGSVRSKIYCSFTALTASVHNSFLIGNGKRGSKRQSVSCIHHTCLCQQSKYK